MEQYALRMGRVYLSFSPNKPSFRGPGGVGRGINSHRQAKICARELAPVASVASRRSPVASRLLNTKIQILGAAAAEFEFCELPILSIPQIENQHLAAAAAKF